MGEIRRISDMERELQAQVDRLAAQIDEQGGQVVALRDRAIAAEAEVALLRAVGEMDAVAIKYAHKLALDLECILGSDYGGAWYDPAMQTISGYRMEMNAIHERESPTHIGEPLIAAPAPPAEPTDAEAVCAEAYQVVGSMLDDLGQFDTERGGKILNNLAEARLVHKDVLPWPSFAAPAPAAVPQCWCLTCRPLTMTDIRMALCPTCGNKRCPRANNHMNLCSGSNEPGQWGSAHDPA